jgi:hypothetical protein
VEQLAGCVESSQREEGMPVLSTIEELTVENQKVESLA